jgi:HK97 family phage prohead protease
MTNYELRMTNEEGKREEERRAWPARMEVRGAGEGRTIEGYAAVFNVLSEDLGGWRERIAPGAFARSIADNDVRALWDHDSKYVLGRNRAGTLELAEDERGLSVAIEPPATTWADDLAASMKRGDVNQMSFGFYTRVDEWLEEDGLLVRVLRDVDLFDVSVVTFPAYPQTSAEARRVAGSKLQVAGGEQQPGPADEEEGKRARARARRAARQREIEIFEV